MTDFDPELQEILRKKASSFKKEVTFFKDVNQDGVTHINDNNIDEIIQTSPLPVLVDFSADAWCRPCQVMAPVYEDLSHDFARKIVFLKINTDQNPQASGKYQIFSVPTFVMFKTGKRIAQRAGAAPKVKFKAWIEETLKRSDE
ncbi:MAG: thioredoxin [Candidatus Heimdallarchaeota archaeon]|nr:thioredoxin [Candidatus Heimdallarchaeota archaeon]